MSSGRRLTIVIPALTLAVIAAANIVVGTVALGSFVFAGDLAPYSAQGIRIILLGCCVVALLTALTSGLRGAIATPPAPLMIVMAGIGAGLAVQGDRLFVTMAAAMALGALATGLCAALVGSFRLTHLVRFVPYPLACGFVSGTGARRDPGRPVATGSAAGAGSARRPVRTRGPLQMGPLESRTALVCWRRPDAGRAL